MMINSFIAILLATLTAINIVPSMDNQVTQASPKATEYFLVKI